MEEGIKAIEEAIPECMAEGNIEKAFNPSIGRVHNNKPKNAIET